MPAGAGFADGFHEHTHGDHQHRHKHTFVPGNHGDDDHGWHSPAGVCGGDDTFGEEDGPRLPSGKVGEQLKALGAMGDALVVVTPYVPGMLHEQVVAMAGSTSLSATRHYVWMPVDVSASQYDYWDLIVAMAERGKPFAVVEQDTVPPPGALDALFACPEPWCGHSYQVWQGDIVECFGDLGALGLTCFKGPAVRWLSLVLRGWAPVTWSNLDGMVYRALRIPEPPALVGLKPHVHEPPATHLHNYGKPIEDPALFRPSADSFKRGAQPIVANPAQSEPPVA